MGRTFAGMGFSMAPAKLLTTEDTEDTGDFLVFFCNAGAVFAVATARRPPALFPFLFFSVTSVSPVVKPFRFLSARATASANQAAFSFPRAAGRLLVHSAEPLSPPISRIVRPVRTDVL